jgi:hypothetical protein
LWGLGKYDYAAIKYGYGEMVEVYKGFDHHGPHVITPEGRHGISSVLETEKLEGTALAQFFYLNEFMPEYNKQRYSVPEHSSRPSATADNYFRGAAAALL